MYHEEGTPLPFLEELDDWEDWDWVAFCLGRSLGVFHANAGVHYFNGHVKWVCWTDNPLGDCLHNLLRWMVLEGLLEERHEPDRQFRAHKDNLEKWTEGV